MSRFNSRQVSRHRERLLAKSQKDREISRERKVWHAGYAQRLANDPIIVGVGVASAAIGIVAAIIGPVQDALSQPGIEASVSTPSQPFEFPFQVKNTSKYFWMYQPALVCRIAWLRTEFDSRLKNVTLVPLPSVQPITEQPTLLHCPVNAAHHHGLQISAENHVLQAKVYMRVTYLTRFLFLSWERTSKEAEFNWDAFSNPPRWIHGTPGD